MISLICAALFFVGIHLFISGTSLRDTLVARLGSRAYLGLFSALTAIALAWMIWAYIDAHEPRVTSLVSYRWIAATLNLVALVFIVFGVMAKSPTGVGGESALNDEDPARALHRVTRHPMLWGFVIWGATHIVFNPEPTSLLFFGAFVALALFGTRSIDAKRARALGEPWQRYLQKTSNVPFVAIAQGRNRFSIVELTDHRLLVALGVWATFLMLHGKFFSVPAI
jgi:uncharacterized membrane protein